MAVPCMIALMEEIKARDKEKRVLSRAERKSKIVKTKRSLKISTQEEKDASEEWRELKEFGGRYSVSNIGRVRNNETDYIITQSIDRMGYMKCSLAHRRVNGVRNTRSFRTHRLVASAFFEYDPSRPEVNHINSKRDDNRLANLEYVSRSENMIHAIKNNIKNKPVIQYDLDGDYIGEFINARHAAEHINVSNSYLRLCIRDNKQCRGYLWGLKYEEEPDEIPDLTSYETIKEFPDYKISRDGLVYSTLKNRILKSHKLGGNKYGGYLYVVIQDKDKKRKNVRLHRLIAQTFVPKRNPSYNIVNHLDGNIYNNIPENLEWTDRKGNCKHAVDTGLVKLKIVYIYDLEGKFIKQYNNTGVASRDMNCRSSCIHACCSNKVTTIFGVIASFDPPDIFKIEERDVSKSSAIRKGFRSKIYKFSLEGELLGEYDSIKSAAELCNCSQDCIRNVCIGNSKTSNGFIWSYENNAKPLSTASWERKRICQYDGDKLIAIYESGREAGRAVQTTVTSILKVCKRKKGFCKGFIWRYEVE